MEIEFYDFEDELRSIIFAFEKKTDKGIVMAICNPRFEFEITFNAMEVMMLQIYFQKLVGLEPKGSVTDLKLDNQGILMRNAHYDGEEVVFELILQRKKESGFKKTTSNIIFEPDMLATLENILKI